MGDARRCGRAVCGIARRVFVGRRARVSVRSPLNRALGLGAARDGTQHWWVQRVSAVALVPLTVWFVLALQGLPI
ncbi:MAG: hypothetical protein RML32_08445, partial [Gammaproteobacteria bacterium]|nr:hypothetical protein [Gammaproteobacteria bacterium]